MNAHKSFKLISILFVATFLVACTRPQLWKMPWDSEITRANKEATQIVERLTATAIVEAARGTPGAQPYGTPVALGTPAPQPIDGNCLLDKVGTWSEVNSAGPQRIEVGAGNGVQHVDFYPQKGVKSISYLVPSGNPNDVPNIWFGYGSMWEGAATSCNTYDYIADATTYAKARLDSGHSGLVVDMRSGSPVVVANVAGLNQVEIDDLLKVHVAGQSANANTVGTVPTTKPRTSGIGGGQTTVNSTCSLGRLDRVPAVNVPFQFNPSGCWVIVNAWSNQMDPNFGDHKLLLSPNENPNLLAGGAYWTYANEAQARAEYDANGLPPVTLAELGQLGLVAP